MFYKLFEHNPSVKSWTFLKANVFSKLKTMLSCFKYWNENETKPNTYKFFLPKFYYHFFFHPTIFYIWIRIEMEETQNNFQCFFFLLCSRTHGLKAKRVVVKLYSNMYYFNGFPKLFFPHPFLLFFCFFIVFLIVFFEC